MSKYDIRLEKAPVMCYHGYITNLTQQRVACVVTPLQEVVDEFETWFRKNRRPPNPMTDEVRKDVERMLAADPDIARRKEKPRIQNPKATNMLARPTRR